MDENETRIVARSLRLAIIRQQYRIGNLTEADALELLSGPLTPGDETTVEDDRDLLNASLDEIGAAGLIVPGVVGPEMRMVDHPEDYEVMNERR